VIPVEEGNKGHKGNTPSWECSLVPFVPFYFWGNSGRHKTVSLPQRFRLALAAETSKERKRSIKFFQPVYMARTNGFTTSRL
jgi:hypothetical protein